MTAHRVLVGAVARVIEPPNPARLAALLEFRASAPLEVQMTLSDDSGSIVWLLSRDVLADAARGESAGLGDVLMWREDDALMMRLSALPSRTGNTSCLLALPLHDIWRFLALTHDLVPYGQEAEYLEMDTALRNLLDAGA